jgi:hypothetical protein
VEIGVFTFADVRRDPATGEPIGPERRLRELELLLRLREEERGIGGIPHEGILRSIELLGTEVAPAVRDEIARDDGAARADDPGGARRAVADEPIGAGSRPL